MQRSSRSYPLCLSVIVGMAVTSLMPGAVVGESTSKKKPSKPDYPPHAKVLEGFDKVVSTVDGKSMYTIWTRKKDGQMYAELPTNFASKKYFIALTIASGERFAGLQAGDIYVYWRKYHKRLALLTPNVEVRSSGDRESKASVKRLFTDRVLLENSFD